MMEDLLKDEVAIEEQWQEILKNFEAKFGPDLQMESILFLIGVQVSGKGIRRYDKTEKMGLMHIATCELLSPYGYYTFTHRDDDGWPHYEPKPDLPALSQKEQELLLKKAIVSYSRREQLFEP